MSTLDIKKLRELHEASTPGPWRVEHRNVYFEDGKFVHLEHLLKYKDSGNFDFLGAEIIELPRVSRSTFTSIDAEFIAEMRNQLPGLLDEIERLREALEHYANDYPWECNEEGWYIARQALGRIK